MTHTAIYHYVCLQAGAHSRWFSLRSEFRQNRIRRPEPIFANDHSKTADMYKILFVVAVFAFALQGAYGGPVAPEVNQYVMHNKWVGGMGVCHIPINATLSTVRLEGEAALLFSILKTLFECPQVKIVVVLPLGDSSHQVFMLNFTSITTYSYCS